MRRPVAAELLAMLLLMLLLALTRPVDGVLPPIRMPVAHGQYLVLRVGDPGKPIVLRMRWDLNVSYLYDTPDAYSTTYERRLPSGNTTEIFALSKDLPPLRLPVVYGQEDPTSVRADTNDGVTFGGSFALGKGSALWRYWTSFTVSKFTLSLGVDDNLDTLEGGNEVHSYDPYFSASIWDATSRRDGGDFFNDSIALAFDLSSEFTLVPLAIFPNVSRALKPGKRISLDITDNCTEHSTEVGHDTLTVWLSRSSSVIMNTWGARESALRIAERQGANSSVITLGRIHITGNFVFFYDFVRRLYRIRQVYDTFPAAPPSQAPQAFLSGIPLLLYVLWRILTWPSLYQWLRFGLSPKQRTVASGIRRIQGMKAGSASPSNQQASQAQRVGLELHSLLRCEHHTDVFSSGPVDWDIVQTLLTLTRLTSLVLVYLSVWGFSGSRFVAHFAQLGGLPHQVGEVFYWMLVGFVSAVPLLINAYFIRRYTHAGISLITITLALLVWLMQLPDTTATFATLAVNFLYSLIAVVVAWEWPFSCLIRGPDARISLLLQDAHEFDASESYVNPLQAKVIPMQHEPVRRSQGGTRTWSAAYMDNEAVLLAGWVFVLLPAITAWFVLLNLLPIIEQFPTNTARFYAIIVLGVLVVLVGGWFRVYRVFLQQLQECSIEMQ